MTVAPPVEVELKLRIPQDAAARVVRHRAVQAAKRGRARRERLLATYFDTPDLRLADARLALRIRHERARWIQTVKGPADVTSAAGLAARVEIEWRLPASPRRPELDFGALLSTPWRATFEKAMRKGQLRPAFTTEFTRTTIPLVFEDGTQALLCTDIGEVRVAGARGRRLPICEVEIELATGNPLRLFDLALALAADLPVAVETTSKAERGYALLGAADAAAVRARRVEIAKDATAADALVAILRECVHHIERNADGVVRSHDAEYVHQMRVGTRRLRSALALARPHLSAEPLASLATEVRWLGDVLGETRDLDVLLGHTLPALVGPDPAATTLARLIAPLVDAGEARRQIARRHARAAVRSMRYQRLLLALGALLTTPLLGAVPGTPGARRLEVPARLFAADVLARRYRKLARRGGRWPELTAEERHAVRIATKRMRYAAEFFSALFGTKRARRFCAALARLQDALGLGNDAAVALAIAARICGPDTPATSALAGWAAAQAATRDREIAGGWSGFLDCRPFWKSH